MSNDLGLGMTARATRWPIAAVAAAAFVLIGNAAAQNVPDDVLADRVVAALENASDLPANSFTVAANDGVVTVTGSVICEDCGGMLTPGGTASVQQSLGAVVRAVSGVERVEFDLEYRLPGSD